MTPPVNISGPARKASLWKLSRFESWLFIGLEIFGLLGVCFGPPFVKLTCILLLQTLTGVFVLWRVGEEVIRPTNNNNEL